MSGLDQTPVQDVSGVGPQKAEQLRAMGIHTVLDLLEYFPYRYEDYRIRSLYEVKDGDKITVNAAVYGEPTLQRYGKKTRMTCRMMVESVLITTVWFNRHFLKDRLTAGTEVMLTGKWDGRRLQLTVAQAVFGGANSALSGTLQPVYSIGGEMTQVWLRKTIRQALKQYGADMEDLVPQTYLDKYQFMKRSEAILHVHEPDDRELSRKARLRMAYEELFLFELKILAYKALSKERVEGSGKSISAESVRQFADSLPFQLTASQKEVINEILRDLREPYCMNRLLQGDVGSGKTAVAATALYAVMKAGYQGAFMAPTEILAAQHAETLRRWFEPFGFQTALLTGSLTERQRKDVLASLQMGITDLVVGTHALIQEDVYFRNLGLVVTDEQHRFGVQQRSVLRRKGMMPDVLTMTATPIPRTLAITAFGDMDVSTLRELPQGRQPIKTYWVKHNMLERILAFIGKEILKGRQAYVICPLIEESEKLDVQNALDLYEELSQYFGPNKAGLLHGRLSADEKQETMRKFQQNEIAVLVSTTVIEVGVDVPNATIMVIYDADRFGLSQLHQLRGRVGRGKHLSYCILIADPKTDHGRERMKVMCDTLDGFEIAGKDLELRGPGDFFGTKQSGLPEFRFCDLLRDFEWLEKARDDVSELLANPNFWTDLSHVPLRQFLHKAEILKGELLD